MSRSVSSFTVVLFAAVLARLRVTTVRAMLGAILVTACSCHRTGDPPPQPAPAIKALRPPVQYSQSIVIPSDPGDLLKKSVADAAQTLGRMTGAEFRVSRAAASGEPGATRGIVLIRTTSPGAPPADVERLRDSGPEAFVLKGVGTERLLIVANGDLGLVAGVYEYLRRLGCRWLLPNEDFTIIPHRLDVGLEVDVLVTPAFASRLFVGTGGLGKANAGDPKFTIADSWDAWKRRNGFGGSFALGGHTGEAFNVRHRAVLEAHPEYFALVGGKRVPWSLGAKLCVSNPAAAKLYVDDRLAELRTDPTRYAVSVDPADGGGHCECDRCRKIGSGSVSDQVFYLANLVAKAVAKEFPGGKVSLYAYSHHADLPTIQLEPNVYVSVVADAFQRTGLSADDLLRAWAKRTKPFGVYTYWALPDWYNDVPSFDFRTTPADRIRLWHSLDATSVYLETTYGAGAMGLGLYVSSRLLWDPATDDQALADEFFRLAFEKSAVPMRRMLERWSGGLMPNHLALAYRDLAEARALAKGNVPVERRIQDFEEYVHYLRLWGEYQLAKAGSPERRDKARAVIRWLFRIEPTAMVSSFRVQYLIIERYERDPVLRAEFNPKNWEAPGWKGISPPTDAEVRALMAEGRAANQPLDLEERRYSDKLVPLPAQLRPAAARPNAIRCGGPTDFEFEVAPEHAQLEFDIMVSAAAKGPGDLVTVTEPGGTVIHTQVSPPSLSYQRIAVATPKPGRYRVHVEDQKSMFFFLPPAGVPMAMRALVSPNPSPLVYFYVPKGLRRLAMVTPSAVPISLFDGEGHPVPAGASNLVLVDVPKGQDGRVWSFRNFKGWSPVRMLNVPQSFSLSPDTLLVPEDAVR